MSTALGVGKPLPKRHASWGVLVRSSPSTRWIAVGSAVIADLHCGDKVLVFVASSLLFI